jgi:hypothetical protein
MSTVKLTCFDSENFATNRTSESGSSYARERSKKLSTSYQHRRATLSPLHLAHKTLDDIDFKGMSIGLMRLQSRGSSIQGEKPVEKLESSAEEISFLSKHYNFAEHKRLSTRFDLTKLKKIARPTYITEKYSVLAKNRRFAGRSPLNSNVIKGLITSTKARTKSLFNDKEIRLRVNGIMKNFSPRGSSAMLEPALKRFRK